jgi:hypothetical protein
MSEHKATVEWKRKIPDFDYSSYNRDHDWTFDGGATVRASAAPAYQGNCFIANSVRTEVSVEWQLGSSIASGPSSWGRV